MHRSKTVSVVMSTYGEKNSIRQCIDDFFLTGLVDEVIVVNNNAVDGTSEEVGKTKARQIFETKQGYGHGFQTALANATGDTLIMCEPDGTFTPSDIEKLLAYSDIMDVVQGSRTSSTHIMSGANMGLFLKYGNYLVAKIAQYLFLETASCLSDCGCTFRLFSRKAYQHIRPHFRCGGSAFGMELTLLCLRSRLPMCEIPLRYGQRVGQSSVTGNFWQTLIVGFSMISLVFKHRIEEFVRPLHKIKKCSQ
jgi:glycosyltransferase involved in cell wall biosynthesis